MKVGIGSGQGLFCAIAGTDYEEELWWLLERLKNEDRMIDVGKYRNLELTYILACREERENYCV